MLVYGVCVFMYVFFFCVCGTCLRIVCVCVSCVSEDGVCLCRMCMSVCSAWPEHYACLCMECECVTCVYGT